MLQQFVSIVFNPFTKIFMIFRFREEDRETYLHNNLQPNHKAKKIRDSGHELSVKSTLLGKGYKEIPSHP